MSSISLYEELKTPSRSLVGDLMELREGDYPGIIMAASDPELSTAHLLHNYLLGHTFRQIRGVPSVERMIGFVAGARGVKKDVRSIGASIFEITGDDVALLRTGKQAGIEAAQRLDRATPFEAMIEATRSTAHHESDIQVDPTLFIGFTLGVREFYLDK